MIFVGIPPFPPLCDHQEQVLQQQDRIEELEEALRESVRITAQREVAVAQKQYIIEAADEKVRTTRTTSMLPSQRKTPCLYFCILVGLLKFYLMSHGLSRSIRGKPSNTGQCISSD